MAISDEKGLKRITKVAKKFTVPVVAAEKTLYDEYVMACGYYDWYADKREYWKLDTGTYYFFELAPKAITQSREPGVKRVFVKVKSERGAVAIIKKCYKDADFCKKAVVMYDK